jgi:Mycothiol maleylpyruvate isomerase N-terminal domain
MSDLRFPIGKFNIAGPFPESDYPRLIGEIAETPGALRSAVAGLSRDQLETPYRPGGWTVKQVVHHLPDSHMNAYVRFPIRRGYRPMCRWTSLRRFTSGGWRSCAAWTRLIFGAG